MVRGNTQYYVYVTYWEYTRQFYFGSRTVHWIPAELDDYMGSGEWVKFMQDIGVQLKKEILKICPSQREVRELEARMIKKFKDNMLCVNQSPYSGRSVLRYPKKNGCMGRLYPIPKELSHLKYWEIKNSVTLEDIYQ